MSALDALLIINEISRRSGTGPDAFRLSPRDPGELQSPYYDVTEDGMISALDALHVINRLARESSNGTLDAESVAFENRLDQIPDATPRALDWTVNAHRSVQDGNETPGAFTEGIDIERLPCVFLPLLSAPSESDDADSLEDSIARISVDVSQHWSEVSVLTDTHGAE